VAEFGQTMRRLREDAGIGLRELARRVPTDPGYLSKIETGTRVPTVELAAALGDRLGVGGQLVALVPIDDPVAASVRDSQRIGRLLCARPMRDVADTIGERTGQLAVDYLHSPPAPMLEQSLELRRVAGDKLRRARPEHIRDLTLWIGYLSGVLAYATLDLGNAAAALAHADIAFTAADRAGSNELRAWVRGTQSLILRFDGRYVDALRHAERGLQYCDAGTARIRLLCGVAQSAANLGDARAAHQALDAAAEARDRVDGADTLAGLFTFSEAKQAYYSGSSLIWLTSPADARRARAEALTAIDRWQTSDADERSLDDEALAHVYAATASVQLHDLEAAAELLEPILGLPEEQRISWIRKRMARVAGLLAEPPYTSDPLAAELRERIVEYR
jgi:transcriptional regulator with XRE-family HTH domain